MAQKYKVYSEAGSYGLGPVAIYEFHPQKKVTEFIYSQAEIINDEYFIVKKYGDNTAQLLNTNLKVLIPNGKFSSITLSESLDFATVTVIDANPNDDNMPLYGIYDIKLNKLSVPCKYNYIGKLNINGIAAFNKGGKDMMPQLVQGGKWGYINKAGIELCPAKYTWCSTLNDLNIGCGYVGGNSMDGLYGGYWTLIDATGKIVIDDAKYYLADRDPYNMPPGKIVQLNRKDRTYVNEYKRDNILATCDGKSVKEIKFNINDIYSEDDLIEVIENGKNGGNGTELSGLIDLNEKVVVPINYKRINKFGDSFVLVGQDDLVYYLDKQSKQIKPLNIKQYGELRYDQKENRTKDKTDWTFRKERYPWLIYGTNEKGKFSFYNLNFKKVLTDVDSGIGYDKGFNQSYFDKVGTYFKYYVGGKANFFNSEGKSLINKEYYEFEKEFENKVFNEKSKVDSVFAMKNNKWGLISAQTFEGKSFIYDEINVLNKIYTIAKRNGKYYIISEGKLNTKMGVYDEIIATYEKDRCVAREKNRYYPYSHAIAKRKGKNYLLNLNRSSWLNGELNCFVSDSGAITKFDGDAYLKNNKLTFLWSRINLPVGTKEIVLLEAWSYRSDELIYGYLQNNLWGVIAEDGKIITPPKYDAYKSIPDPAPNFDYKGKY